MTQDAVFDITESFQIVNTAHAPGSFQSMLMLHAYNVATLRGFPDLLMSAFYAFRENYNEECLTIECDILDAVADKIAIECYLYKSQTSIFIAKSFFIFMKSTDNN